MRNVVRLVVLLLSFTLLTPAAWAQTVVGAVGAMVGTATLTGAGAPAVPLQVGQAVLEGSLVQTGLASRVQLTLADGTTLTLGAETGLRLEHLAHDRDTTPSRFAHLVGFLRAAVAPQRGRAGLEISTDSVVAAVRGTVWVQHATPGSTEVFVAVGRVALRGAGGAATLGHGQGVTYHADAPHSPVLHWAPAKIAAFDAATRLP